MNNKKLIFFVSVALASLSASINQFTFAWAASRFGVEALGASLLAGMLPQLLLMSFSGVVADRLEPILLLSTSAILRATVLVIMILAISLQPSALIFIVASFVLSSIASLFGGSAIILIASIFSKDELVKANARVSLVGDIAFVVGPIFAAWIYTVAGVELALFIDATLLAGSGLLLLLLARVKRPGAKEKLNLKFIVAGFSYLKKSPKVLRIVVFFAITNIFMASLQVAMPLYAEKIAGVGSFALLSSAMNIAAMISNIVLATISLKSTEVVIYSTSSLEGLALFGLASVRNLPTAMVFAGLNDAMASINGTLFVSWLQNTIAKEVLGRVYAAINTVAMVFTPFAFIVTPMLISYLGVGSFLYLLAILTFSISLLYLLIFRPR